MCKISDRLQLCTCAAGVDTLKHFWVFHKLIPGKDEYIIGEIVPPYYIDGVIDLGNRLLLSELLNSGNVFDVSLHPAKGDLLVLSFLCGVASDERVNYGFKYTGRKWVEKEYNSLMWRWHHEETAFGKIKNALSVTRAKM